MMRDRVVDLDDELLNTLKQEEMFAFFEFSMNLPDNRSVSGLCKISKPKSADSKSYYIGLLFMVDAETDTLRRAVDIYISAVDWENLKRSVPEIASFLAMPYLSRHTGIYIREVDIYLKTGDLNKPFFERFHAMLAKTAGLEAEPPIFWDDIPREAKPARMSEPHPDNPVESFMDRLKNLFGI